MDSYAAERWTILWRLRVPSALPYIFTALKIAATASVIGAIIGEQAAVDSRTGSAARSSTSTSTTSLEPTNLWATNLVLRRCSGSASSSSSLLAEKVIVQRAPERLV